MKRKDSDLTSDDVEEVTSKSKKLNAEESDSKIEESIQSTVECLETTEYKVNIEQALEKLCKFLVLPKKIERACDLFLNLVQAEMNSETAYLFESAVEKLMKNWNDPCTPHALEARPYLCKLTVGIAEHASSLQKEHNSEKLDCFDPFFIWRDCWGLCDILITADESFGFAKACGQLKDIIRSLPAISDSTTESNISSSAALVALKAAYSRKNFPWAKSTVESTLHAARDARLRFTDGEQREVIDKWTTELSRQLAEPAGFRERVIRLPNSTAHPLINRSNQTRR